MVYIQAGDVVQIAPGLVGVVESVDQGRAVVRAEVRISDLLLVSRDRLRPGGAN